MKEVWKDTKGVFGYQVSNYGIYNTVFHKKEYTGASEEVGRIEVFTW